MKEKEREKTRRKPRSAQRTDRRGETKGRGYARRGSQGNQGNQRQAVVTRRVRSTVNNTKVVRTWYDGKEGRRRNEVTTAGQRGFVNTKRSTVYAAQETRLRAGKRYLDRWEGGGQPGVHVRRRGMGRGRVQALTQLKKRGVEILTVSDATKDPHNGCRRKKRRRI
jgi:small subunit ribosomal protein S11